MSESQSDARFIALTQLVNELHVALRAIHQRLVAVEQRQNQQGSWSAFPGGGGVVRIRMPTGIAAGSIATPSSASAFLLNADGTDGTSINVASQFGTPVTGNKYGWAQLVASSYFLVQADC